MTALTSQIIADTIAGRISDDVLAAFIEVARRAQQVARLDTAEAALLVQLALPVGLEAQRARAAGAAVLLPETAPADEDARNRPLTPDERRGFDLACDKMRLWAAQLEQHACTRMHPGETLQISTRDTLADRARFCRNMAEAMQRGT